MRFKIDWVSLIVGSKFTVFTLYLRAISKYKPPGGLYSEGRFNGGFFALRIWGLIFGGVYFWNFTVFNLCVVHFVNCRLFPNILDLPIFNTLFISLSTFTGIEFYQ